MTYESRQDFATLLLRTSNAIERCQSSARAFAGHNNKAAQLDQIHRVINHQPHQAEI
jgi:hypothetical protein